MEVGMWLSALGLGLALAEPLVPPRVPADVTRAIDDCAGGDLDRCVVAADLAEAHGAWQYADTLREQTCAAGRVSTCDPGPGCAWGDVRACVAYAAEQAGRLTAAGGVFVACAEGDREACAARQNCP